MNYEDLQNKARDMADSIHRHIPHHIKYREVYECNQSGYDLGIALPREFEESFHPIISWGRTAIDRMINSLRFDAFRNDMLGYTRLAVESGAVDVFDSAIKNAITSSCAFVAVFPRDIENNEFPAFRAYSGSQATGIYDNRNQKLEFGLVINERDSFGMPKEYVFFEKGLIHSLDADFNLTRTVELPINETLLVPFIFNQDLAVRPMGTPLLNKTSLHAITSAQRSWKLSEIEKEVAIAEGSMIVITEASQGSLENIEVAEESTKLGIDRMLETEGKVTFKPDKISHTNDLNKMFERYIMTFASSVSMAPTLFGASPANGSFSSDAMVEYNRPFEMMVSRSRSSFGRSIEQVMILAMGILTESLDQEQSALKADWIDDQVDSTNLGAFGDAIGKLSPYLQSVDIDITDYVLSKLRIQRRDTLMSVTYPNFKASRKNAEAYKSIEPKYYNEEDIFTVRDARADFTE